MDATADNTIEVDLATCWSHLGAVAKLNNNAQESAQYYRKSSDLWSRLDREHHLNHAEPIQEAQRQAIRSNNSGNYFTEELRACLQFIESRRHSSSAKIGDQEVMDAVQRLAKDEKVGCFHCFKKGDRKLLRCGGCQMMAYCSAACQHTAWREGEYPHKMHCKTLKAWANERQHTIQ